MHTGKGLNGGQDVAEENLRSVGSKEHGDSARKKDKNACGVGRA